MKFARNAQKAWSTYGIALLTLLIWLHAEFMPHIAQFIAPETYSRLMGVLGAIVLVMRFIAQKADSWKPES